MFNRYAHAVRKQGFALLLAISLPVTAYAAASRSFDGVSDSIDYTKPSDLVLGTDSFTAGVWFYWTDGADTDNEHFISQQDGTGTGRTWIAIDDNDTNLCGDDTIFSALSGTVTCADPATINTWTHVAVRSNESSGVVQIAINGTQSASATRTVEAATGIIRFGVHKTLTNQDFEGQMAYGFVCEGVASDSQLSEMMKNPEIGSAAFCPSYDILAPFWGEATEQNLAVSTNTGTVTGATTSSDGPPVFLGGIPL